MHTYNYFTLGNDDDYGQPQTALIPAGEVKLSISLSSQSKTDNVLYATAAYIGLTTEDKLTVSSIVDYNGNKLKVVYINPFGRYKQVYLEQYGG